jgi:hypothetical protein
VVFTFNFAFTGTISVELVLTNGNVPPQLVTGVFFQATQPVSGTFFQGTQPVSIATMPSTPVTGTFWQATQPVSLASTTVTGSVAVTGAFWQATQPVSGTFWQATQPVSIATMPTTPVTGTFWQATQPVSGAFFQATQPVSIATMPTTPVTGTFWQATQPVSLASTTITGTVAVTGTFWQATQPISGAVSFTVPQHVIVDSATLGTVAVSAASLPLPAGAATAANQTTPVAKGTQGTTANPTQDLKDAGRTQVTLYVDAIAGITTEALATLSITKGGAAQTAATSYTVTAGKTLRLQAMTCSASTTGSTTAGYCKVRVRQAATVAATSPIILSAVTTYAGVAYYAVPTSLDIPDGLEIAGGQQVGISHLDSQLYTGGSTGVSICLIGYEY